MVKSFNCYNVKFNALCSLVVALTLDDHLAYDCHKRLSTTKSMRFDYLYSPLCLTQQTQQYILILIFLRHCSLNPDAVNVERIKFCISTNQGLNTDVPLRLLTSV